MITSEACGKYILVGEHAVVYGCNAIAAPLRAALLKVRIQPAKAYSFIVNDLNLTEVLSSWVKDLQKLLELPVTPIEVVGESNIPLSSGLGSSAALSVAMVRALNENFNAIKVAEVGNLLERKFHGNPSGLDVNVISHEGLMNFNKTNGFELLKLTHPQFEFVIVHTGEKSSTAEMVKMVEPKLARNTALLQKFDEVAIATRKNLEQNLAVELGENLNEAGRMLCDLGLETELMKKIKSVGLSNGLSAMKITGAGGGGCMLGLIQDKERFLTAVEKYILPLTSKLQIFWARL